MTATDLFSTVLFQDGEGIDLGDLNASGRLENARVMDQIIGGRIPALISMSPPDGKSGPQFSGLNGVDAPLTYAYCTNPGGAYLRVGSANNKVQIAPGTLYQKIAAATGIEATLLSFTFDGSASGEWTIATGSANPRYDLLEMKLEYVSSDPASRDFEDAVTRALTTNAVTATRRRVQCTLQVKQGTPGVAPQIPDVDAGFVAVASVLVGASWTAGNLLAFGIDDSPTANKAFVFDQRMPTGLRAYRVLAQDVIQIANWALSSSNRQHGPTTGAGEAWIPCPVTTGRLLGVSVDHDQASGATAWTICGASFHATVRSTPRATIQTAVTSGIDELFDRIIIETPSVTNIPGSLSAVAKIGVPIWCNGARAAWPEPAAGTGGVLSNGDTRGSVMLRILNDTSAQKIGAVTFYVAEGM